MRFKWFYRWYDLWVGAYYDVDMRDLYLVLFGLGVRINFYRQPPDQDTRAQCRIIVEARKLNAKGIAAMADYLRALQEDRR